jgi:hypothetical protein
MTEWIWIIGGVILGLLVLTHAAGVGFIASRVFLSGRKKVKQFSPRSVNGLARRAGPPAREG